MPGRTEILAVLPCFPDLRLAERCAAHLKSLPAGAPERNRIAILYGLARGLSRSEVSRGLGITRESVRQQEKRFIELGEDAYLLTARGRSPRVSVIAVAAHLRGREMPTTKDLAKKLGCSPRTIRRAKARISAALAKRGSESLLKKAIP